MEELFSGGFSSLLTEIVIVVNPYLVSVRSILLVLSKNFFLAIVILISQND